MRTTIISWLTFLELFHQWISCAPILGAGEGLGATARAGHMGVQGSELVRGAATGDHSASAVTSTNQIGIGGTTKVKLPEIPKERFKEPPTFFTPNHPFPEDPNASRLTAQPANPQKPTSFPEDPNAPKMKPSNLVSDPNASSPKSTVSNVQFPKNGVSPELEQYLLQDVKPKPLYPIGKNSKEYWQLFTTRAMLKFISERGTPEMKQWINNNKYSQEALGWFKQETWLGHVLTKYFKVDPKWRIKYDSSAFGKDGLTGKIAKGWLRAWGTKEKQRKVAEKVIRFPFIPLLKAVEQISKSIDKLSVKTVNYFLKWLKNNGTPEIRKAMPNFEKMQSSHVVPPQVDNYNPVT